MEGVLDPLVPWVAVIGGSGRGWAGSVSDAHGGASRASHATCCSASWTVATQGQSRLWSMMRRPAVAPSGRRWRRVSRAGSGSGDAPTVGLSDLPRPGGQVHGRQDDLEPGRVGRDVGKRWA